MSAGYNDHLAPDMRLTAARERHRKCDTTDPCQSHEDHWAIACDAALFRDALDECEHALNGCIDRYSRTITAAADMQADLNNARALADELVPYVEHTDECVQEALGHLFAVEGDTELPCVCGLRATLAKWEASR